MKIIKYAHFTSLVVAAFCATNLFANPKSLRHYSARAVGPAPGFDYFEPRKINNKGEVLGRLDASTEIYKDHSHAGFYTEGNTLDLQLLLPTGQTDPSSLPVDLNDH